MNLLKKFFIKNAKKEYPDYLQLTEMEDENATKFFSAMFENNDLKIVWDVVRVKLNDSLNREKSDLSMVIVYKEFSDCDGELNIWKQLKNLESFGIIRLTEEKTSLRPTDLFVKLDFWQELSVLSQKPSSRLSILNGGQTGSVRCTP